MPMSEKPGGGGGLARGKRRYDLGWQAPPFLAGGKRALHPLVKWLKPSSPFENGILGRALAELGDTWDFSPVLYKRHLGYEYESIA